MIIVSELSKQYEVRDLTERDVDQVLELYQRNALFFQYTDACPTREQVLDDMKVTPSDIDASDKYFVGFFDNRTLVTVMDLVDGYPEPEIAFIGLFMMNHDYQGKEIGTAIINETMTYLRTIGKKAIRLAIDKGNPQSTHFWQKNGFEIIAEVDVDGWPKLVAEKVL